jgi:hypothetical protein
VGNLPLGNVATLTITRLFGEGEQKSHFGSLDILTSLGIRAPGASPTGFGAGRRSS